MSREAERRWRPGEERRAVPEHEGDKQASKIGSLMLLTDTSKMGCYSFSLPAGPTVQDGTCLGAAPGFMFLSKKMQEKQQAKKQAKEDALRSEAEKLLARIPAKGTMVTVDGFTGQVFWTGVSKYYGKFNARAGVKNSKGEVQWIDATKF